MDIQSGDIVRVTAKMAIGGVGAVQNVFYLRKEGIGEVPASLWPDDIGPWLEDIYGEVNSLLTDNLSYDSWGLFNITQDAPGPDNSWPTLIVGGSATDMYATGVAGLGLLRTERPRVVGRKYFGGLVEGGITESLLTPTMTAAIAAAIGHMLGSFIGGASLDSWLPGVVDKSGAYWSFTEAVVKDIPAYQRRRKQGRGI
jgi:hypothetical protein